MNALSIALKYLKFRPRTVFEVKEKLKSKKFDELETEKVIKILIKNKLLDDVKFAQMYVRDRNLLKPTGKYLLKIELRKLGIAENEIEKVLKNQDEERLAKKAIESKARYRNADFTRQAQFLSRRGFSSEVIYRIVNKK